MNVIDKLTGKKSAETLVKDSEEIVETFTSTINKLVGVNENIDKLAQEKKAEKEQIEKDLATLEVRKAANDRIRVNLANLLS